MGAQMDKTYVVTNNRFRGQAALSLHLSLNRRDSREQERQVPAYLHLWDEGKGTGFQRRFP
jgi:hypothetical protein